MPTYKLPLNRAKTAKKISKTCWWAWMSRWPPTSTRNKTWSKPSINCITPRRPVLNCRLIFSRLLIRWQLMLRHIVNIKSHFWRQLEQEILLCKRQRKITRTWRISTELPPISSVSNIIKRKLPWTKGWPTANMSYKTKFRYLKTHTLVKFKSLTKRMHLLFRYKTTATTTQFRY